MPSQRSLIESVSKIPLFKGLSPSQVQKLLAVCVPRSYQPGEQVCGSDAESDEMFILILGALEVKTADGVRVATVIPVSTVGEMGVVMKQPRSATVEAIEESHVFCIPKMQFDMLLQKDVDMQVKVYRNIIEILASKIISDNVRTRDYELEKGRRENLMREQAATAEIALDLLVRQGGMSREEAESYVAAQKRDSLLEVLIVDDEPEIRRFVKQALSTAYVMEAANGREAVEILERRKPHLVITDIRMPQMDGFKLLTHLREMHPDIPVWAISGIVSEEDVEGYDFDRFVEKPIQMQEFRDLVDEISKLRSNGASD